MFNIKHITLIAIATVALVACNRAKPKPVATDISKNAVTVNGKKDSVDNNSEKNYSNATISSPCLKCLLVVIQNTDNFKKVTANSQPQNIIYNVNWITSKTPQNIGNGKQVINGMAIAVNLKGAGQPKTLSTYLYDNQNAQFYLSNDGGKFNADIKVDSAALKTIRRKCFWGVASAK